MVVPEAPAGTVTVAGLSPNTSGVTTVNGNAELVEAPKLPEALYAALIVSNPTVLETTVKLAVPFPKVAVPSEEVPLKNVTVPLGTPAAEVTVTLRVSIALAAMEDEARLRVVTVGIAVTVTATDVLVEAPLFASPAYWADKLCIPGPLRTVDNVALTFVPDAAAPAAAEPIMVVPSKKFTVPVGAAVVDVPATVAIKAVLEPACTVEGDTVNVVIEGAALGETVTVTVGLVDSALLASPTYCADRLCAPSPLRTVDNVALTANPDAAVPRAAEPIIVVPSKKFTIPVGNAFDCIPVTVAVSTVLDPD